MTIRPLILQPDSEPYGACRALLRSIRAMPRGAAAPVVVFPYEGAAIKEYEAAGCQVVVEPLAVLRRSSAGLRGLIKLIREQRRTAKRIAKLAQENQCDLIHTNSMSIITGARAAKQSGIAHIWQLREAPAERGLKAAALQLLLKRADQVIAVSEAAARLSGRVDAQIVYDGYDPPSVNAQNLILEQQTPLKQSNEFLVGMLGRISPSKAPDTAVKALIKLKNRGEKNVRLVLAGTTYTGYENYAQQEIIDVINAHDLSNQIDILGWVDDPQPILAQLDALIIATASGEGFPGAVLEALAFGVPVVSCATGGVDELVIDGKTGIKCSPKSAESVDEVTAAITALKTDPDLYSKLSLGARKHAAQWSVKSSADTLLAAWRRVVA